jgi:hypothetical protein
MMDMNEVRAELLYAKEFLTRTLGYDSAKVELHMSSSAVWISIEPKDDFQEYVGYNNSFNHGIEYLNTERDNLSLADALASLRSAIYALPGREMRELTVLMRQAGDVAESRDMLVSAAGRDFAAKLVATRAQYAGLLTAMQERAKAPPFDLGDDYIPL